MFRARRYRRAAAISLGIALPVLHRWRSNTKAHAQCIRSQRNVSARLALFGDNLLCVTQAAICQSRKARVTAPSS
ncbi:hypothetical protein [Aeoliella mucimassa]|uniref:hypothetical protein n=1 Tax=Aeoliella mucimassa TaxID=2527972 RepID=UPI00119CC6AE|nr:hypothetical protein [Aeoliella mucimassa]